MPAHSSHSWIHPALEVLPANIGGKGVFARVAIEKGAMLTIFGGHVMKVEDEPIFDDGRTDLCMQIHDGFVLGPKFSDEIEKSDLYNHNCNPNAGFQGQIFLVAMRDIEAGEQVCFDYAMVLNLATYRFQCCCSSANCRRVVTGEDWKIPELQSRYDGWFQWYLQEKIKAERAAQNH